MVEPIENVLRNMYGQEITVLEQSKYTDITISSQVKEGYVGDCNGQVIGLSSLADGKLLLVPFKKSYTYRYRADQQRTNIYSGGKMFSLKFHPHRPQIFAAAIEDMANKPPGIAIIIGKYNKRHMDDLQMLNKDVELLALMKPVHAKRGVELFWSPIVSDLLYSVGNEEVILLAFNNKEKKLQKICSYVSSDPAFAADACLNYTGKYLFATFNGKSTGQRGNFLKIFAADSDEASKSMAQHGKVDAILSENVGMGQTAKVCALPSGYIVVSRFINGKRQLGLYEYDEVNNKLIELDSKSQEGSSPLKLRGSQSMDIFYTFGKGDTSMSAFCINSDKKIHFLGILSQKNSMTGVVYLPEYSRSVMGFEFQRMVVFCQANGTYSVGTTSSFILPRRGDPSEVECYSPLLYFEPSATLEEWVEAKKNQIKLKLIDPVENEEFLQNHLSDNNNASGTNDANNSHNNNNNSEFFNITSLSTSTATASPRSSNIAQSSPYASAASNMNNNNNNNNNNVASKIETYDKKQEADFSSSQIKSKNLNGINNNNNNNNNTIDSINHNNTIDSDDVNKNNELSGAAASSIQIPQRTNHLSKKVDDLEKLVESLKKRIEHLEDRNRAEQEMLEELDI